MVVQLNILNKPKLTKLSASSIKLDIIGGSNLVE
jgi:hypothetical protein